MQANADHSKLQQTIEQALLGGVSVSRVIDTELGTTAHGELMVASRVDLAGDLTMREVSVVLHQAKRRVQQALVGEGVQGAIITLEPDVYLDPNAATPTTSSIVMLSID